jgi:hypothetical protein
MDCCFAISIMYIRCSILMTTNSLSCFETLCKNYYITFFTTEKELGHVKTKSQLFL